MSTMIQVTEPTMVLNEEVCKSNIARMAPKRKQPMWYSGHILKLISPGKSVSGSERAEWIRLPFLH